MGNITIQGDLTGGVPGGEVGGASNLTTVGAIPYVSEPGVLNQDASLSWNSTGKSITISVSDSRMGLLLTRPAFSDWLLNNDADFKIANSTSSSTASNVALTIKNATKNILVGGVTDGNYKLDIQKSGSTGTLRVYDQTATTGSTLAVIQAGAGQSGALTSWRTSAGVETLYATSAGEIGQKQSSVDKWYFNYPTFRFASASVLSFSSTTDAFGTLDLGLARNAAGVLEINNGTAGTYRDILARRHQASGETVASLPAAAAGNSGTISYVTDANATTIGSTVAGGGANKVLVWSDGTAWKIFAN